MYQNMSQVPVYFQPHVLYVVITTIEEVDILQLALVIKDLQLPMLLILTDAKSETQKLILRVFPSVEGDKTSHIIDGTY